MHKHRYYAAGLILLIGVSTAMGSLEYSMGTLSRMGPGYFPLLLGSVLTLIAFLIAILPGSSEERREDAQRESLRAVARRRCRPWGATVAGVIAFVVLGKYGGLVPATFVLIFIAALGDSKNSLKSCFWLATGVVGFAIVAFHYGLQLQFPLFSWG